MSDLHRTPDTTASQGDSTVAYRSGAGDEGRTRIGRDGAAVGKNDARLTVYGDCEEASAAIGVATALSALPNDVVATLVSVQNDLADVSHDLGASENSTKGRGDEDGDEAAVAPDGAAVRISSGHVARLDRACSHYGAELERPDEFVLPCGTAAASTLFWARTVVRRAERSFWSLADEQSVNPLVGAYLNRLSTLLFLLARVSNIEHGDTLWRPGVSVATDEHSNVA